MTDPLLEEYRETPEFREARLRVGRPGAELGGLSGGALAFFLASWNGDRKHPPSVIITATQEEADELVEDLEVFAPGRAALFPAWESLFVEDSEPDPELFQGRLSVLDALAARRGEISFIVAPIQAVIQPVPTRDDLEESRCSLRLGADHAPGRLADMLVRRGYRHVGLVDRAGEFSLRGGVLDLFPCSRRLPLRLEFFGDTIDSLREFDPATQRSITRNDLEEVELLLPSEERVFRSCFGDGDALLFDLLDPAGVVFLKEPEAAMNRAKKVLRNLLEDRSAAAVDGFLERLEAPSPTRVHELPVAGAAAGTNLHFRSVERFRSREIEKVFEFLAVGLRDGMRLRVYCENDAELSRLRDLLRDHGLEDGEGPETVVGGLRAGFEVSALGFGILTSRELFNRHAIPRLRRKSAPWGRPIESFLELERGDYVVHLAHGIGRFLGIESLEKDGVRQEFLVLQYRNQVKIYVPVSRVDLVQKYIGSGDRPPLLDRVGGTAWERKKSAVETALMDFASELLEIHASREERPGIRYGEDSEWQVQFEASFPYRDTPDQVQVTEAIKEDMQSDRPMDRLICGDVGYGKTELAMRAAFKAVDGRRQVAVLVPTTVLAEQHFRTFRERAAEFPLHVEVLSRFRTHAEQKKILRRVAEGTVDILVGTHRLLSNDVEFANLGLVIVDEEQRFGVLHKEKLKRIRREVDVITLSATPIPRTLHMALLGIRDISNLTTPPEGRSPIHTEITRFDRRKVREIIIRELNRDGQILFIHNRVVDIGVVRRELESIVPEARVDVGHGQMNERLLEEKMQRFIDRETDLLIATTIVENGIDIPTANTIIINEADRFGLADLHQLRGRVGRSRHQAYCYLLLPDHRHVAPDARKRLQALVEFSGLGAGFQIAMRDLEIRGAGNILGKEQSGHIATVGYDMFCRLLDKVVHRLKNEEYAEPVNVEVDLAVEAYVPDGYLSGEAAKVELYRRIAKLDDEEAIADLERELADRFGGVPEQVRRLLEVQRLRVLARRHGVSYIGREDRSVILRGDDGMERLLASCPGRVGVLDKSTVAVPLRAGRGGPGASEDGDVADERIFDFMLDWMKEGRFPRIGARPRPRDRARVPAPQRRGFEDDRVRSSS